MFTTDVINAIVDTVYDTMNPDSDNPDYTIYTERVPQDLSLPCFFIQDISDSLIDRIADGYNVRSVFDVTYFPKEDVPDDEFTSILDKLMPNLNIVGTKDNCYRTSGLKAERNDDSVTIEFTVDYDCIRKEAEPLMETLWQNQRIKSTR